jgi:DNA-binding YbaB/EbfC family protein
MARHSPGTGIDLPTILASAAAAQGEMAKARERLKDSEVVGTAGGGMVRITLGGDLLLREVSIDPAAVETGDADLVGEMFQAAMNEAMRAAQELAASMLGDITAGGLLREGL